MSISKGKQKVAFGEKNCLICKRNGIGFQNALNVIQIDVFKIETEAKNINRNVKIQQW